MWRRRVRGAGSFLAVRRVVAAALFVCHLEFSEPDRLRSAFGLLSDARHVESCTVEPDGLRLRFLARRDRAEQLLEEIDRLGGLRWCSRHPIA